MASLKKFILLCCGILLLTACEIEKTTQSDLTNYVAQDAIAVLKISNLKNLKQEVQSNPLAEYFKAGVGYRAFTEKNSFLDYLNPEGASILSVTQRNDSVLDYAIATRESAGILKIDSTLNKQVETLTYDGISVERITLDNTLFFTAAKDSVFIVSTSQQQLEQLLKQEKVTNNYYKKALTVLKNDDVTSIVKEPWHQFSSNNEHKLAAYQSLDVALTPNGVIASGVALVQDSVPQLLGVFKGQIPQQNDLENVLPKSATQALSFTLSDASLFVERLEKYNGTKISEAPLELLSGTNEIGELMLPQGNAVVLKSIDATVTQEALAPMLSEANTYREVSLFTFDKGALFKNTLSPFIQTDSVSVAFQLERFFVFAQNTEVAENIISSYKNNACLNNDASFQKSATYISNASSLLIYGMNTGVPYVAQQLERSKKQEQQPSSGTGDISLGLLQYSFDRDFAHVHFACLESSGTTTNAAGTVTEVFNKTLPNTLLNTPQFFTNYRTGRKYVAVQDISNTLYVLTETGKTAWTKKLEDPIMGEIHEIDILRNGKKQITFATKNKWYVLDRNGKDVSGFPVSFRDDITQPLAVFDYDNNRKYRFVIVQDKEVLMYDSNAKIVKGFTFKKSKSSIVLAPSHIRMGNKDYVLIAEENGSLNILSRTGKIRVPVKETFKFSENTIEREQSNFVVITSDNKKKSINTRGQVTTTSLDVSSNYHFITKGNTKVTLDDNLLRINGKLTELPFGIYTAPKIYIVNRKTYITVTETQEKKVYVVQKDGSIVNGFPVFGSSNSILINTGAKNLILTQGSDKEIILYQF
ncbi:hypothetical protein G5B37_12280 [Rasiella rasia]|uniref:Uncharacterized protein n=1 Tax=Rasiella rasia TaxID=2744027 RepID=A0A6G6GPB1_9FLAO|nr:hypothetical protein [Rasiella rasia]QIE60310.1 hypothetical protein G5B37_12280 [Rasiella rasia]